MALLLEAQESTEARGSKAVAGLMRMRMVRDLGVGSIEHGPRRWQRRRFGVLKLPMSRSPGTKEQQPAEVVTLMSTGWRSG